MRRGVFAGNSRVSVMAWTEIGEVFYFGSTRRNRPAARSSATMASACKAMPRSSVAGRIMWTTPEGSQIVQVVTETMQA